MAERKFKHGGKEMYSLAEKDRLGKLKDENERKKNKSTHIKIAKGSYFCCSCSSNSEKSCQTRQQMNDDELMKNQFEITEPPRKSKFCNPGGGRKVAALDVREAFQDWFIDVRSSLKAHYSNPARYSKHRPSSSMITDGLAIRRI